MKGFPQASIRKCSLFNIFHNHKDSFRWKREEEEGLWAWERKFTSLFVPIRMKKRRSWKSLFVFHRLFSDGYPPRREPV